MNNNQQQNNLENKRGWKRHFTVKNILINGLIAIIPGSLIIGILRELGLGGAIVICGVIFGLMYLIGEIREKITYKIRNRTEKDRKKEEDENIQKLKSAKTGQPVTISKSYGIIGPNGEDNGKRFVRKEDAEKRLIQWLQDAEQIPEEGESTDEFRQRVGGKTPEEEDREKKKNDKG